MEKSGLSEFMKFAYEQRKVKEVEKAFEEYPVMGEWHEGKIENVLCEESEAYNEYMIGDIVFVKQYQYENGKEGHNHLFVIIDQNNMAVPIENFGMLISSQLEKLKYQTNKLIKKDKQNGLNKDSIVKTDIIYKISNKQILFKIGEVDKEKIQEYKKSFYHSIKLEQLTLEEIIKRNEIRIQEDIKEIYGLKTIDFIDIFPISEEHREALEEELKEKSILIDKTEKGKFYLLNHPIKTRWGELKFLKIRFFDETKLNWEAAPDFVVEDWKILKSNVLEDKRFTFIHREKWDAIELKTENSLVYFLNPLVTKIYDIK